MKHLLMSSVAVGALLLGAASVSAQSTTETTLVVNSIQTSAGVTVNTKAGDPCSDGIDALHEANLRSQTISVLSAQLVITATKPGRGRGAAVLVCESGAPTDGSTTGGSTTGGSTTGGSTTGGSTTGGSTGGSTDGSTGGQQ